MKTVTRILAGIVLCILVSCGEPRKPKPPDEEARIEREVNRRVETIRGEMRHSQKRWHTTRVVFFCILAGGSLIWLSHLAQSPTNTPPDNIHPVNPPPQRSQRIIDRSQDDEHDPYENHR